MKNKKFIIASSLILIILILIFVFKDTRNMDEVNAEQEASAKDSANSKIEQINNLDDLDLDDEDIEDAALAYDTLNPISK